MSRTLSPAIIMCTWQRAARLPITLRQLSQQQGVTPHLYIWNNNPDAAEEIDRHIADRPAGLAVSVHHNSTNIGGFGRFMYARQIAKQHPYVIFIDDDQELPPDAIRTLAEDFEPRTIKGWHAFNFITPDNYWLRLPVRRGGAATYVGTCGMVADSRIFTEPKLFECPDEYKFIEDLWLCYVAEHHMGWKLRRSRVRLRFVIDTKNQVHGLMQKKTAFLSYLASTGWNVRNRGWKSLVSVGRDRRQDAI